MPINRNFTRLEESYLFSTVARKAAAFEASNPGKRLIRLSIGDITRPLCPAAVQALEEASADMGRAETFHGYGPEQGYPFLREAVAGYYAGRGTQIDADEIFISDGAKSDLGNFLDLFAEETSVLIPDPVYPVYVDASVMGGHPVAYMDATRENGFLPMPDVGRKADIVFLCSPNNPTGAVYTHEALKAWVDFARENGMVILFDAAYEAFVTDTSLPRSIFEIEGAKECAVEFCSFSKTAGFTGTRCGYTVVPKALKVDGDPLRPMWLRRQTTKFNGVPYIVQRAAQAVLTGEGLRQCRENIAYYRENARIIREGLDSIGVSYTGGVNAPYIWMDCPEGQDSWAFFDRLLSECGIVGTPGAGFGKNGAASFRLTAFGKREDTVEAMERIKVWLHK